jgi:hypothetical protein
MSILTLYQLNDAVHALHLRSSLGWARDGSNCSDRN